MAIEVIDISSDATDYRCSSCGCTDLPPVFRRVLAEFEALTDREKLAALDLVFGYRIYGMIPDRGWTNQVAECIRRFLPSFFKAKDMGDIEPILLDRNDLESAEERPEAWSKKGSA